MGGGASGTRGSVKMGVSEINIGHSGTEFIGIRGGGGLMRMRCPWMDVWRSAKNL